MVAVGNRVKLWVRVGKGDFKASIPVTKQWLKLGYNGEERVFNFGDLVQASGQRRYRHVSRVE